MKRTTIKFLAEKTGVSAKTVSKALNNRPGVNEETRSHIKALAKKFNYMSNAFGRGLKGIPSKTIGVITSDNTNPNNAFLIKGIENKALEFGYVVILCNANEDFLQEEKYVRLLIERQVDGLILTPSYIPNEIERKSTSLMEELEIPFVILSRSIPGHNYSYVKTNDCHGGALATNYLIDKGHKNILHLSVHGGAMTSVERETAFWEVMRERNLEANGSVIYCDQVSMESAYKSTIALLQQRRDFTAVFAFNDIIALGAMRAISDCNLRIPEDIAIIGYDNIPYSSGFIVPLTTIQQDSYNIGLKASEILLEKIGDQSAPVQQVQFEPTLVERKSV